MVVTFSRLIIAACAPVGAWWRRPHDREPSPRAASPELLDCAHRRLRPGREPRPRGHHLDAVGRHDRAVTLAVVRGRLPDDLVEHAAEGPEAREADVEADVGDAAVGLAQQEHRPFHPPPLQVAVRRLPEDGAEAPDEVGLGDMGDGGHGADVERLGVGAVHGVAGAQQAPVEVLGLATHVETLRHPRRGLGASAGTSSRRARRRRRTRRASRGRSPRHAGGPGSPVVGHFQTHQRSLVSSGVVSASSLPARSARSATSEATCCARSDSVSLV